MTEGDKYDDDDLDLWCLMKKGTSEQLPGMKKLKQLGIKDGDVLVACTTDEMNEIQQSQGMTTLTILREDDDDLEVKMSNDATIRDVIEVVLKHIKGDKFKKGMLDLYSLVPEGDSKRYDDSYIVKDCKKWNTLRFYCGEQERK